MKNNHLPVISLLSPRENEVVNQLVQGRSNKQIALALGVSERTVEFHLKNIYIKMQVGSRVELILKLGRATGEFSGNLVESTVVIADEKNHNGNQPAQKSWAQPLRNLKAAIKKEIVMSIKIILQDVGDFLRKRPLFFSLLLFLAVSTTTRYVVIDIGLYYWLSYVLLAVLLGIGSIAFGLTWKKISAGEFRIHPLIYIGIMALLPLIIAVLDEIFLYTIVKDMGPIAFNIFGISVKAAWDVSASGADTLRTERSIVSEVLWFISVGYMLLFFLMGVLSGKRSKANDLAPA